MSVVDYFKEDFERIRKKFGIDKELMWESFFNFENINKCKNLQNLDGGRSNAYLFITFNQRFVIKIVSLSEKKNFLSILPDYFLHLEAFPKNKIVKIFGFFEILPEKISVIVMENLIRNRENYLIFDIKGSLVDRKTEIENYSPGVVLKDRNFLEGLFKIKLENENNIVSTLVQDIQFLMRNRIIDYSLLIGIPYDEPETKTEIEWSEEIVVGIIDIGEKYTLRKASEKALKSIVHKSYNISAAQPNIYGERMKKILLEIFKIEN